MHGASEEYGTYKKVKARFCFQVLKLGLGFKVWGSRGIEHLGVHVLPRRARRARNLFGVVWRARFAAPRSDQGPGHGHGVPAFEREGNT